jgi:hypothetical protein
MESVNKRLQAIKTMFSGQDMRIEELYEENEDFRTLCADYFLCRRYLQRSTDECAEKQQWLDEYKDLSEKLENELTDYIFGSPGMRVEDGGGATEAELGRLMENFDGR